VAVNEKIIQRTMGDPKGIGFFSIWTKQTEKHTNSKKVRRVGRQGYVKATSRRDECATPIPVTVLKGFVLLPSRLDARVGREKKIPPEFLPFASGVALPFKTVASLLRGPESLHREMSRPRVQL